MVIRPLAAAPALVMVALTSCATAERAQDTPVVRALTAPRTLLDDDPLALETLLAEWRSIDARLRAEPPPSREHTDGTSSLTTTEWPLFSRVYFALASCALASRAEPSVARTLRAAAARALDEALAPSRTAWIHDHFGDALESDAALPSTLLHGNVLYAFERCGPSAELASLATRADRIATAFERAFAQRPDAALPSYRTLTWITDNLPALAALELRARRTGGDRPPFSARWITFARERSIDARTGLVIAPYNTAARRPIGPARGCATMMSQPMLAVIDATFAADQWSRASEHLVRSVAGLTGAREYAEGVAGRADRDSGRIVLGMGEAASGFAIAAAASMGDHETARRLAVSAWLAASPRRDGPRIETSLPTVGHAIILYGKSLVR
ncbi:MAG: hypothetical protein U0269_02735 [Polyangiales bacterium]